MKSSAILFDNQKNSVYLFTSIHTLGGEDERYSNRQETRMKLGGFMGEITYGGDFGPFRPYIRLGEYVHVGKGVVSGWGGMRLLDAEGV